MIKVQNLVKAFGPKVAVNNVTFAVGRGEVLGFLGPNGAGKSTTMRMVTGFIPPSSGGIQVGGYDMLEESIEAKQMIGYLPENAPLYADMTVWGFLNFAAELRGFRGLQRKQAVERVIEMCFLESVIHQSVDTLSKGYRHRTCFAQAVIHDPDILIMDEPTDGLDPNQKHEVREIIRRMGSKKAIIFSTHILEEVEAVCTRAIIIDRGQIVANGGPAELKRQSAIAGSVTVRISQVTGAEVKTKLESLSGARKTTILEERPEGLTARVFPAEKTVDGKLARQVGEAIAQAGWRLEELHTEEGRLDEVFRSITLSDTNREIRQ
ncbi:MAG TPA: ATP-binding cassette domain-containing protein [Candidatus Paceibacterota bacterium]|nr:ATP-binding cassette domain-containing protein [Verrucomicrobiota bacterium]HRY48079.1 ATP-binding cassette domain-containing protein [Candidatus Paceibacterota bacterium]